MTRRGLTAAFCAAALVALVPPAVASNSDAVNAVAAFDPEDLESFERLEQVIEADLDGDNVNIAVLRQAMADTDRDTRWAAVYIAHNIARTPLEVRALSRRRGERDPSIRAMVLYALLGHGEKQSIPALIRLLSSREYMLYSEPLDTIAQMTSDRLERMTGARFRFDFGASARARRKAIRKWNEWWRDVRGNIRWDRQNHRYRWRGARSSRAAGPAARSARPAPSASPPASPAASTGSPNGESVTITIKVELSFDASITRSQRRRIQSNVERAASFLNGPGRSGQCVDLDFTVEVETRGPQDPATEGYHQLDVNEAVYVDYPSSRRSFVRTLPEPGRDGSGRLFTGHHIDREEGMRVAAHELSHLSGLGDEYTKNPDGTTTPHDPDSYLADSRKGQVLQRHLDAFADRFGNPQCEKYALFIEPWTSESTAHTESTFRGEQHFIGERATANIRPKFWLNPRNNRVYPAGEEILGDGELADCCDSTPPSGADCTTSLVPTGGRVQFHTSVAGERQGDQFRLQLGVNDSETFAYSCRPAARPPTGEKSLIREGMRLAGALDFTIARPAQVGGQQSQSFSYSQAFEQANGSVRLTRLE